MTGKSFFARICYPTLLAACAWLSLAAVDAYAANNVFLQRKIISSTIPANGDLNPYGVAFVPDGFPSGGVISPGDVLVSNFNDIINCQGRGTTIIQFSPNNPTNSVAPGVAAGTMPGNATTFFTSSQFGLSTALGVLKGGFVLVGNVSSPDDSVMCGSTPSGGVLQVIDRNGNYVTSLTDNTGGNVFGSPWDLTIVNDKGSTAQVFVSNVLTGTIGRLDLVVGPFTVTIQRSFVVAKGYATGLDPAAFVLGPTGLAVDHSGNLFVASTLDNAVFKVPNVTRAVPPAPVMGTSVFADLRYLRGPLGLPFSAVGTLLTANGDAENGDATHPSEIVEFTTSGAFIRQFDLEATQGGAFGIATATSAGVPIVFNFAAVDDITNSVVVHSFPVP